MWGGDHGWKKFRKAVIAGVHGHAQAYEDNTGAPMEIQMLDHDLELEIMHAKSELQADRGARAESVWGLQREAWVSQFLREAFSLPLLIFPLTIFRCKLWLSWGRTLSLHSIPPIPRWSHCYSSLERFSIHSCAGTRSAGGKQPPCSSRPCSPSFLCRYRRSSTEQLPFCQSWTAGKERCGLSSAIQSGRWKRW